MPSMSSPSSCVPGVQARARGPERAGLPRPLAVGALWAALALPALAEPAAGPCPAPAGPPLIQLRTAGKALQGCDLKGLMALPEREVSTTLPRELGIAGKHRWTGVSLKRLVERLGGGPADTVQLGALNDYTVTIPWSDLQQYDPVLAYQRGGQAMSVRDKGPLILIYPFDAHPGLRTQNYVNRTIWQVNALTLK